MKRILVHLSIVLFFGFIPYSAYATDITFTTINYPGASATFPTGIDGKNIVGYYWDASGNSHGFLYNGSTYTTLDYPANGITLLYGIDGSNIVGLYQEADENNPGIIHGFLYNGSTFILLDVPGFRNTEAHGISGNNIVGYCYDDPVSSFDQGFIYNGSTYTTFSVNPSGHTLAYDIDGNNIVGHYQDQQGHFHGFLYNGTTYTTLDFPGASFTSAHGINGNNIVGEYDDDAGTHGFLYNGSTYTPFDVPGTDYTLAMGIDGLNISGFYYDVNTYRGFLANVPGRIEVTIEIRPWSDINWIDFRSYWPLPVAILSTDDFDAVSRVDQNSLTFGATGDEQSLAFCSRWAMDINHDGLKDLGCEFYIDRTGFQCGDTQGILKGATREGTPMRGGDSVRIIPCKK